MEKVFGEEEIKGLEEEIESAVDRLFVEKGAAPPERIAKPSQPPVKEKPFRVEKDFDFEGPPPPPPPAAPSAVSAFKSLEKMEGQLLSLEWEINKENLTKTKEEVVALRRTLKEKPEVESVLNLMDKVLNYMLKNEDKIRPPLVKFLMDCKETLKLLMRKEADSELNIYKQLAYMGIQGRYSSLDEFREARPEPPPPNIREEIEKAGILINVEAGIAEVSKQIDSLMGKMEGLFEKIDVLLSRTDRPMVPPPQASLALRSMPVTITVFKVEERLLGVESDKVYKLFRVPIESRDRYVDQQKIRLKDFEVTLIDLRKVFSLPRGRRQGDSRILAVHEDGRYIGLMIDQVLEKLSTQMEMGGNYGEYCMGVARWTYQERPIEISVLDLKKF